jgi:hypothetical protein
MNQKVAEWGKSGRDIDDIETVEFTFHVNGLVNSIFLRKVFLGVGIGGNAYWGRFWGANVDEE